MDSIKSFVRNQHGILQSSKFKYQKTITTKPSKKICLILFILNGVFTINKKLS